MLNLPKTISKRKKRLGRGYGSGKGGHTVGRGQKGQKTRGKIGVLFEGIKVKKSLLKKLPLRRGKMPEPCTLLVNFLISPKLLSVPVFATSTFIAIYKKYPSIGIYFMQN